MSDPIRIGIVGCGRIVPAHLRGYATLRQAGYDNFRITALLSRQRSDAEMFRQRGEGPTPRPPVSTNPSDPLSAPHMYVSDFQPDVPAEVFDDFDELLRSGTVDALDIPASVFAHHDYAVKASNVGKHVLVQKPLAVSVAAGRLMVEEARRNGVVLGVTENARYTEGARCARWAISRDYLGETQMVSAISVGTAEWSPDKVVADTPWRHRSVQAGGGPTIDIGVHLFHRVRFLCGEVGRVSALVRTFEPVRYRRDDFGRIVESVEADVEDAFMATFELQNGGIGQMSFTWSGHGESTGLPGGLSIYGSKGCLKGEMLFRDGQPPVSVRDLFYQEASESEKEHWIPLGLRDSFAAGFFDFLTAIERGSPLGASGEEGLRDLAASFAILESATLEQPVQVDHVLSGRVRAAQTTIDAHHGLL
ncbi:MAG TPA: Gfo/Idh/MocA family oxidoreductase [Chloroflexota bacterium]|nr:Gfo/Idh/MocA family oxidoreductase [Chloroflexota bacterium]